MKSCIILGVYYGGLKAGGHQLAIQLVGILFTIGWSLAFTWCILQIIDKTIGLRISEEDEIQGLDTSIHGETIGMGMNKKELFNPADVEQKDQEIGMSSLSWKSGELKVTKSEV